MCTTVNKILRFCFFPSGLMQPLCNSESLPVASDSNYKTETESLLRLDYMK